MEAQKEEIEGKKEEIELSEKSEVTEISDVSSKDPGEWVQISKKLRNYLGEEKVNELIEFTKNLYYDFVETNRVFALLENNFYKKDLTKEYVAVIDKYKELKDDEGNLIWITVILKSIKDYFKLNQKTILLQKSEECQEIIEDNKLDSNKILDIASYQKYFGKNIIKDITDISKKQELSLLFQKIVYIYALYGQETLKKALKNESDVEDDDDEF